MANDMSEKGTLIGMARSQVTNLLRTPDFEFGKSEEKAVVYSLIDQRSHPPGLFLKRIGLFVAVDARSLDVKMTNSIVVSAEIAAH